MPTLPAADIRRTVRQGLEEDLAEGDATTAALFSRPIPAQATIIAQQPIVVAGMAAAVQTFLMVDSSLRLSVSKQDGDRAKNGDVLLQIDGDGRSIVQAERVALNFLQHLSGIATLTQQFCRAVRGYPVSILDTRKTLPGWRRLQKWAVALGGGTNHRYSLSDGILIKDNHLALLQHHPRPVEQACKLARRRRSRGLPIIVEVESLSEVRQALAGRPEVILLDNMDPDMVRRAVAIIEKRTLVEASGGITLKSVRAMAAAGVDRISIGALTHSAPAAPVSLVMTFARRAGSRRR
jgi:nicotinate-nucleotide pyrophosphorylase (carboxylating)